jgi:hypothetical protein
MAILVAVLSAVFLSSVAEAGCPYAGSSQTMYDLPAGHAPVPGFRRDYLAAYNTAVAEVKWAEVKNDTAVEFEPGQLAGRRAWR